MPKKARIAQLLDMPRRVPDWRRLRMDPLDLTLAEVEHGMNRIIRGMSKRRKEEYVATLERDGLLTLSPKPSRKRKRGA